jgi:hypothetical protein
MAADVLSKLRANKTDAVMSVRQELGDIADSGEKTTAGLIYRTRLDAAHTILNTISATEAVLQELRYLRWIIIAQSVLILLMLFFMVGADP